MNAEQFFPPTEQVVSDAPLVIRRVVRWGDCDPAGIVYTPRFLEFTVSAYEAFIGLMLSGPVHAAKGDLRVDFPVRGVELDFQSSLALGDQFEMTVRLGEIRTHTFDLVLEARRLQGPERAAGPAFSARITPITVDPQSREARALPSALLSRLTTYAASHSALLEEHP